MTRKKTWFITGAGRGMGVGFAKAALGAGHNVVATGRNTDAVAKAVGEADDLLVVTLDVTSTQDADAAVKAAVDRFGRIDVLINNAASFEAGFFEELTPEQIERQLAVSLIGPMNVTRAVLPVMRRQRSGHVVAISSLAGLVAAEYTSAYAASKFAVDGWMEALAAEIGRFGIHATVVNPGYFRTELLSEESTNYAAATIEDYAERSAAMRELFESTHGKQPGDPAKLAQALLAIVDQEQPPFRFIAGADAIAQAEQKLAERKAQIDAYRELSSSLGFDDAHMSSNDGDMATAIEDAPAEART
jgi:NAD(P)-dependent dehydrogenase (short-subunit alcohol dehydrogenase family)